MPCNLLGVAVVIPSRPGSHIRCRFHFNLASSDSADHRQTNKSRSDRRELQFSNVQMIQAERAALDPKRPSRRKRYAASEVLCSRQDYLCCNAYLYVIFLNFNGIDRE